MSFNPKSVRILNPLPTGSAYVSHNRAQRYVQVGRAEWLTDSIIKFNVNDSRYQAAMEQSYRTRAGYAERGMMTLKEMRNIPILNPTKLR